MSNNSGFKTHELQLRVQGLTQAYQSAIVNAAQQNHTLEIQAKVAHEADNHVFNLKKDLEAAYIELEEEIKSAQLQQQLSVVGRKQ